MTDTPIFSCSACGAPNKPEAGTSRMACTYCGTNLTIPENLQTAAMPRVEKISSKAQPVTGSEIDASDLLRKAQPVMTRAWNMFAYWTWIRRLIPACLGIVFVFILLCFALGALPFVWQMFR